MARKKVLISCNRILDLGGIEKSLTTFLKAFDTEKYDVTLVLYNRTGEFFQTLDLTNIHTVFVSEFDASHLIRDDIIHLRLVKLINSLFYRLKLRLDKDWYSRIMCIYKIIERAIQIPGHFDLAYSFTTDYSDLSIILKVDADKRACMIHGDASRNPKHARLNDPLMRQMDRIFAVSESAGKQFLKVHPSCAEQIDVLHNLVDVDDILKKSMEAVSDMPPDELPTICTVGRLDPVKGQHLIPKTVALLQENGCPVHWYIVGEGSHRAVIEDEIKKYHVEGSVTLLGAKENPYPYIRQCTVYVQPSLSEAWGLSVQEAKIIGCSIVSTNFSGIEEQIVTGENGLIVDAMTPEAMFDGIKTLLDHPELRQKFIDNLSKENYDNSTELQKLYDFIEG